MGVRWVSHLFKQLHVSGRLYAMLTQILIVGLNWQAQNKQAIRWQPRRHLREVVASGGGGGFGPASTTGGRGTKKARQDTKESNSKGFGPSSTSESDADVRKQEGGDTGGAEQASPSTASIGLQAAPRDEVIAACLQTSALIAVLGFGLHQLAPLISPAVRDGGDEALKALLQCEFLFFECECRLFYPPF